MDKDLTYLNDVIFYRFKKLRAPNKTWAEFRKIIINSLTATDGIRYYGNPEKIAEKRVKAEAEADTLISKYHDLIVEKFPRIK